MVPGGQVQAGQPGMGAQQRGVVRGARSQTGECLLDRQLEHPRDHLVDIAQQLVETERGDARVEALLLHRRAEDHSPVLTRDQVAGVEPHHAVEDRSVVRHADPDPPA